MGHINVLPLGDEDSPGGETSIVPYRPSSSFEMPTSSNSGDGGKCSSRTRDDGLKKNKKRPMGDVIIEQKKEKSSKASDSNARWNRGMIKRKSSSSLSGRKRMKKQKITFMPQREYYEKYTNRGGLPGTRSPVSRAAHKAIHAELREWQEANGGEDIFPLTASEWYLKTLCKLIDEGLLTMFHCEDVCRNPCRRIRQKQIKSDV